MRIRTEKPDALDLEALRDAVEHPGFKLIAARIASAIAQAQSQLESAPTWDDTLRTQGMIAGLRRALAVPTILAAEIRGRGKSQ